MQIQDISLGKITAEDHSQRLEYNEEKMTELVSSISSDGLLEPLSVKQDGEKYIIIFGHRRFEALKRLGWEKVPCILATGDEATMRRKTFAENFFRDDLTPVELAASIKDEYENNRMTLEQLAFGFKKTVDWVKRQIALVEWPTDCLEAIHLGKLSIAAASNLAEIKEDEYRRILVGQASANGATARVTAAWLQAWEAMLPPDEAMQQPPIGKEETAMPMIPKAPCTKCSDLYRPDEMCYIPLCQHCLRIIRTAGEQ